MLFLVPYVSYLRWRSYVYRQMAVLLAFWVVEALHYGSLMVGKVL